MMLTSGDRPSDVPECQRLGISAYLLKPIKQSELLEAIQLALGLLGVPTHARVGAPPLLRPGEEPPAGGSLESDPTTVPAVPSAPPDAETCRTVFFPSGSNSSEASAFTCNRRSRPGAPARGSGAKAGSSAPGTREEDLAFRRTFNKTHPGSILSH